MEINQEIDVETQQRIGLLERLTRVATGLIEKHELHAYQEIKKGALLVRMSDLEAHYRLTNKDKQPLIQRLENLVNIGASTTD